MQGSSSGWLCSSYSNLRSQGTRSTDAQCYQRQAQEVIGDVSEDILARAAAFLLVDDSRASFAIEREQAPQSRIQRWGQAIGESGSISLSLDELLRLHQIVIGDFRFVQKGLREEGGFIGQHDRSSGNPLPVRAIRRTDGEGSEGTIQVSTHPVFSALPWTGMGKHREQSDPSSETRSYG